ncbi:hypothetical protein Tco_1475281 [Tanacetum coccineum]
MTRSSTKSKTSLAIAANLSELELNKILIDKMESNKSIHISDEQKNLYKALVDAYESDKLILDTYGDTVSFKRRRDDEEKDEEPFAPKEKNQSQPVHQRKRHPRYLAIHMKGPDLNTKLMENLLKQRSLCTLPKTWKNSHIGSRRVIPFDHFINNDLEYLSSGVSSRKYAISVMKTKAADYGHIKWIEDLVPNRMWSQVPVSYDKHALWGISHWGRKRQKFYGFADNMESARDVYSKRRIIAVTKLEIVDWHNYKHLDWITVRRDDDKLYKFKEGNFNRLRIQDIEDLLLLLVQGKLTNLTVEERLAFNVSKVTKRSSTSLSRIRTDHILKEGKLTQHTPIPEVHLPEQAKKEGLMRIDELHKFSDGRLNDVRTFFNDRLKGIRMEYLPQTIWRQSDKDKAGAMIQAIDKQLKTRRIMRSLEKFVGGRPYEEHSSGYRFTVKMEILLEPTSNKLMVGRIFRDVKVAPTKSRANDKAILYPALLLIVLCRLLKDGRESIKVKEFQRSFSHSDTERLSRCDKVLKLKNFKKDATLKLFKSTNQERYEHVGPEVSSSQDGKGHKMAKKDYAWLMISRCSRSHSKQAKEQAQDL